MEGKCAKSPVSAVIAVVLLLGLVVAEAKGNCPTTILRNCYNVCRLPGTPRQTCARTCGCTLTYCKLGCAASACISQNSAVKHCMNACAEICTNAAFTS
ncbi:hypothetical protein ACHQM5_001444 [Ranunculus cassubicifolius]